MGSSRWLYAGVVAVVLTIVIAAFGVLDSSQAVYTDQTDNTANTFGAAPSFEQRTYYLHDDPTPPVGNTTARLLLAADQVVPTAQTLYNYSSDLDSEPGRHLDGAGYDKNRTDPAEAVAWRLPPTAGARRLVGAVMVDYWVAQDDFVNTDETKIKWFLRDFSPGDGTYTEIEEIEFKQDPLGPSGDWVHVTTVFPNVDYILASGHVIELKAEAGGVNANLAYDTEEYPSFVVFPEALDIAVTDLTVVSPVGVGEVVTVTADVENQGADETSFNLVLTDLTTGLVVDTSSVSLPVFASQPIDLTWDTTGTTLGNHDLQVEAVVAGDIDPADNIRTVEVDVKVPVHNIALGGIDAPGSIGQGGQLVLTLDVENKGNRTETFDLVLTDTTAGVELDRKVMTLGIGVKVEEGFVWDTSGASVGKHVLEVEAVVAGDSNPGDNVELKAVEIQAVDYDIRVANLLAPDQVGVGEQVPVDVEVENNGNIATTFDLILRDTIDNVTIETRSVTVPRGDTLWFPFVWDSTGASIAVHVLEVEAVVVGDSNPGDNSAARKIAVQAVDYDIRVANVLAPDQVGVGEQVPVDAEVENNGNIATTFDLILRDVISGLTIETRSVTVPRGDTLWFLFVWDTSGASVGKHVLEVEAVVAGDSNPGDNVKLKAVEIQAVDYDIRVVNVVAPSPVGVGEQVPVDVQVENKGNIATTFDLVLRDTTDSVMIETRSVTVPRGETLWFAYVWDSTGASIGDHLLEVEAAVAGDSNPGDNVKTKTVAIEAVDLDIRVVNVVAPSPVTQGDVVSVGVEVENKGNIATTFDLILRDTTDNVIIETRSVTVARGATDTFTYDWDTTGATPGAHVLEAEAVVVGDSDPGDNTKTKTVTVNP